MHFCRKICIFVEQPVKDAVITVPPYFNQAERRAMVNAAEIAGLNLLQLMNDNTAGSNTFISIWNGFLCEIFVAGVNYGMFRRKEFNTTATTVLIYDMGSVKTTATVYGNYQFKFDIRKKRKINLHILEYQLVQDKITKEKNPQMTILGVGLAKNN